MPKKIEDGLTNEQRWRKKHNFTYFTVPVHAWQKERIKAIASERGVSLGKLARDAIEAQYGIDLSTPAQNESEVKD